MYTGIAASDGVGIGSVFRIPKLQLSYEAIPTADTSSEQQRLLEAIEKFSSETAITAGNISHDLGSSEAEIFNGHLSIISDPEMTNEMNLLIYNGKCAEDACAEVCDKYISKFFSMDSEILRERAADIQDIKISLLKNLVGIKDTGLSQIAHGAVIVVHELTPSMISHLVESDIAGIIAETGGRTSHAAILARSMGVPTVLSVPAILDQVCDNDIAIVDGSSGHVHINPSADIISSFVLKSKNYKTGYRSSKTYSFPNTFTADIHKASLFCNIGTPDDISRAIEYGAEGIGLFRSEYLFMNRAYLPDENEQFEAYKSAAVAMDGRPVIIRTLDTGGDKTIPALQSSAEENPYLGYRGIRCSLGNPDIYKVQLRALLRASSFGKIRIMIPMVTCPEEVRTARSIIFDLKKELDTQGIPYDRNIKIGCMIETAAASLIADILAKEVSFFSIGTNDLTQYTMSADRGNPKVAYLYSPFQPAVLRSIRNIIKSAQDAGIPVGMCGEAAADPHMIPLLISFGLNEYSVSPALVPEVRRILTSWTKEKADELACQVMSLTSEKDIIRLLKSVTVHGAQTREQ